MTSTPTARAASARWSVVSATPAWAAGPHGAGLAGPADPNDYAGFVAELARQIPALGAIEIWNEADEGIFWRGGPEPAAYAALLRAAYPAIKGANPAVKVVSTGMVANDHDFLEGVYAAGGGGSFDAVGVHTDTACLLTSPADLYREPNGRVGRYSFTGYRELHHLMTANGDGAKGIWMTEIGWNTGSRRPGSCRDGAVAGTRPEGVTEKTQARFLTLAYRCLAADPYVDVAMWFSLQDVGHGAGYGDHLGLIRPSGSHKPAYRAMRALHNGRGRSRPAAAACRTVQGRALDGPRTGRGRRAHERGEPPGSRARAGQRGRDRHAPYRALPRRPARARLGRRTRVGSWFGFRGIGYGGTASWCAPRPRGQRRRRGDDDPQGPPEPARRRLRPVVRWRSLPVAPAGTSRIAVEVRDRGPAGLRNVSLSVDGRRVADTRRRGGVWRPRVALRGGVRTRLTIRAEDRAGNVTRSTRRLRRR